MEGEQPVVCPPCTVQATAHSLPCGDQAVRAGGLHADFPTPAHPLLTLKAKQLPGTPATQPAAANLGMGPQAYRSDP